MFVHRLKTPHRRSCVLHDGSNSSSKRAHLPCNMMIFDNLLPKRRGKQARSPILRLTGQYPQEKRKEERDGPALIFWKNLGRLPASVFVHRSIHCIRKRHVQSVHTRRRSSQQGDARLPPGVQLVGRHEAAPSTR